MRPRGLIGPVMGMARPARPPSERETVVAAAKSVKGASANEKAGKIAAQVARRTIEFADTDPMSRALLRVTTQPTPIETLATCPIIDTLRLVNERRAKRFEERGCQQLGPLEWAAETRAIEYEVSTLLTHRYRRWLK